MRYVLYWHTTTAGNPDRLSTSDDLFAATAPDDSVFADKAALDPLAGPAEIHARESQERALATILNGVHEGYLPPTVSIYGPPGTGKTLTTQRVCREFAARHDAVAVEYVNLKECRTLFSAANEILVALTGERKKADAGLDGVFAAIWAALADYPAWTVLLLDEIDHVRRDTNDDPTEFFDRLLRGEGKLERGLELSVWLLSNDLLEGDRRLDSRVESAMSDERVFCYPIATRSRASALVSAAAESLLSGCFDEVDRCLSQFGGHVQAVLVEPTTESVRVLSESVRDSSLLVRDSSVSTSSSSGSPWVSRAPSFQITLQ